MSEEIIKILDELCNKFGIAIDWTSQNIAPYLQELVSRFIKYKMITDCIWILVGIILLVISIFLYIKLNNWKKSNKYDDDCFSGDSEKYTFGMIGIALIFITSIILIIAFLNGVIQTICIPELTIIKYIEFYLGGSIC